MVYIRFPFATSNGDKVEPPAEEQVDDSVSYEEGYSSRYSEDPATSGTARRIERNEYNGILFRYSTEIQQYQQNGFPDFITSAENGGAAFPYQIGAIVRQGTTLYKNTIASNVTVPPDTGWIDISTSIEPSVIPTTQTFSANGVWNKPAGCRYIKVQVLGAGGGGGATGTDNFGKGGNGGGAGGYAEAIIDVTTVNSVTVTVGSGGAGGLVPNDAGTPGGTSSFISVPDGIDITSTGGSGGGEGSAIFNTSANSAGGTATGGYINIVGGQGRSGGRAVSTDDSGVTLGGSGGGSYFGSGASGPSSNAVGIEALTVGCGGSGGAYEDNTQSRAGGDGQDGIIIVTEYYN